RDVPVHVRRRAGEGREDDRGRRAPIRAQRRDHADEPRRLAEASRDVDRGVRVSVEEPLTDRYAAISNYYFAQAIVPLDVAPSESGAKPACAVLTEQWFGADQKPDDDQAGDVYHARLEYPARTLAPHESATYRQIAFFGPKERDVLAKAAGGRPKLQDLINLGTFSIIAKVLVTIITWIH